VRAGSNGSAENPEEPTAAGAKGKSGVTTQEAKTIASWHTISGGLETASDWLPDLPPERLDILRRTMPPHGKTARPVDYFENDPPRAWVVTDDQSHTRRDVVALFNWSEKEQDVSIPLNKIGLPPGSSSSYAAFDYWSNKLMSPLQLDQKAKLPPHGCLVLAIRLMLDRPFLISTSRHITQGMVDVMNEQWDEGAKKLSGESEVVAGDPYELRIVAPAGWRVSQVSIKSEQVKPEQSGDLVRASVTPKQSGRVRWEATFNKG